MFLSEVRIDVEKTLTVLQIPYKHVGSNFVVRCISGSHVDNNPSLQIDVMTGVFNCPVCHFKGNLSKFVATSLDISTVEAADRLKTQKVDVVDLCDAILRAKQAIRDVGASDEPFKLPSHFQKIKPHHKSFIDYLQERKVSWQMILDYDIRCCFVGRYNYRVVIPIIFGRKCRGFIARDILKKVDRYERGDDYRKYLYPSGMYVGNYIFNYDNLDKTKDVYVVEGVFDVINVVRQGFINCCGMFGTAITDRQTDLLKSLSSLVVISDQDDGGSGMLAKKVIDRLQNNCKISYVTLPIGMDPGSCDDIGTYIRGKVEYKPIPKYTLNDTDIGIIKK